MPSLCNSSNRDKFLKKLKFCERHIVELNDWESQFVQSMREKYDERESMLDMGITPWNPSVAQWNTLGEIHRKIS